KTLLAYDSTPLTSRTGVIQHDDFDFGATHTVRGNLTQIQKWVSGTTYLTTTFNYDTTGQVVQQTDSAGNMTSRSYTDRFYSDNGSNPPTSFTPATATNAYVTSITSPIIGTQTYGYYWGSGKQAVSTDQNGASAYSHYLDAFDRPTLSVGPTGGWS